MIRDYSFIKVILMILWLIPWSVSAAVSDSDARVGRYAVVHLGADPAQADLLAVVVRVTFAPSITTVGEALDHLLARSGFALAPLDTSDPNLPVLLTRPLPQVQRRMGPIRLQDALEVLAGPAWVLVIDPVNRLVSYELAPEYRRAAVGAEDGE